ncbi:hypothetical protein PMAYCL1PPCAC_25484, partial [Pristionchus mayeri]
MGIFSALFGKKKGDKKKADQTYANYREEEPRERRHLERGRTHRSVHYGEKDLPACYRSVGRRHPKGPRSCPGAELVEDERSARVDFDRRMSSRGHRNLSSEDLRPSKDSRGDISRIRRYDIDSSSDDEVSTRAKIRQELRMEMQEKEEKLRRKYNEIKRIAQMERREKEDESRRNKELIDQLYQEKRELDFELNNLTLWDQQGLGNYQYAAHGSGLQRQQFSSSMMTNAMPRHLQQHQLQQSPRYPDTSMMAQQRTVFTNESLNSTHFSPAYPPSTGFPFNHLQQLQPVQQLQQEQPDAASSLFAPTFPRQFTQMNQQHPSPSLFAPPLSAPSSQSSMSQLP